MKRIILLTVILFFIPSLVSAEGHYVTQTGSGADFSVDQFNNAANWNSVANTNDNKIGPGDTVYFSGTITSQIKVQGSGISSNYITLDGSDASVEVDLSSLGCCRGAIDVRGGLDYLRIQNFDIDGLSDPLTYDLYNSGGIYIQTDGTGLLDSKYIEIDGCTITRSSSGITLRGNVNHVTVTNNYIDYVKSGCFQSVIYWVSGGPNNDNPPSWITVGGSPGNGNTFKNCGYNDMSADENYHVSSDVKMDMTDDVIVSYNHLYSDRFGMGYSGMYMNDCRRVLVEYNTIHGHTTHHNRGGIDFKEDMTDRRVGDIIVRYNHVYDEPHDQGDKLSWGDHTHGIMLSKDIEKGYVYGNYVHDSDAGIRTTTHWGTDNDIPSTDNYVFSNIVENMDSHCITFIGSADYSVTDYYFNNMVYRCANNPPDDRYAAFYTTMSSGKLSDVHINNNVIYDSAYDSTRKGIYWWDDGNDMVVSHNHHYNTRGTPMVHYMDSSCAPCEWNSGDIPSGYGVSDTEGDPKLNSDFTISSSGSPLVDSGIVMGTGNIDIVTIQDVDYLVRWDAALHPSTDWSTIPPTVITASQSDHGSGWERGAYVYVDGEVPDTCESLGGYCCATPAECQGADLGTFTDCLGTCCNQECQVLQVDTCTDRGFDCCDSCVPGTAHPENDTDCSPQVCCGECLPTSVEYDLTATMTYFSPLIDGEPSEDAWGHANRITFSNPSRSDNLVEVRTLWDSDGIYFLYDVTDQNLEAANQSLWNDDGAELYLDTGNEKGTSMDSNDYHFTVNIYDLTQEQEIQSVTKHNPNGYTMEMSIPWSGISSQPSFGMVMGLLLANNDRDSGVSSQFDWLDLIETGPYNRPNLWGDVLFTVRADTSRDGCVYMNELVPFIDSWKYDSTAYPMREMMEAVVLYYSPGSWC